MPGVRIHHPELRDCTLLVPHPGDPETGRRPKDYHIRLDSNGDCIVSETIWQRLKEARDSGLSTHDFIVMNEVKNPPDLKLGFTGPVVQRRTYKQMGDAIKEIHRDHRRKHGGG